MDMYKQLTIVAALIMLLAGCNAEQQIDSQREPLPQIPVSTTQATLHPVQNLVEILGTVTSVHRADIAAKVSGTISVLPVRLGSDVTKGDLLVEISAGEIDAQLQQARAQLEQAQRNLDRERKLLSKNAATQENVKSLEESLAIAQAAYRESSIMQSYTSIRAPFNGRVTQKKASVGDLATPGKVLLKIEDDTLLQVITDIPEAFILRIQPGNVFPVSVPSAGLKLSATVAEVAPAANPTTRSAPVKLDLAPHAELRPGQFARVSLTFNDTSTITVPRQAVLIDGQMEKIFVVDEHDKARLRLVTSGAVYGDAIEILSGIRQGEQVVTDGHHDLVDGQPVTL